MATGDIHMEAPTGAINGVNVTFTTAHPINSSVINVWLNGILIRQGDDDGFTVTGVNTFDLKEAPVTDDTVHVRYEEA